MNRIASMVSRHQKTSKFISRSIEKNKLAHAYIFYGPQDVGKFNFALDLAERITSDSISLKNYEILVIRPEIQDEKGKTKELDIKVLEIRELQRKIRLTSWKGKRKVAIIDRAEKMTTSAQNALLKTLEEPPENTVLILVTKNKDKLLSTVLSRCQKIKFGISSNDKIEKLLSEDVSGRNDIIFWSLGREELAQKMLDDENELRRRLEAELVLKEIFSLSVSEKLSLAENMSKNISLAKEKMDWWQVIMRGVILGDQKRDFGKFINRKKAFLILGKIEESFKVIEDTNASARLVLENLLLAF